MEKPIEQNIYIYNLYKPDKKNTLFLMRSNVVYLYIIYAEFRKSQKKKSFLYSDLTFIDQFVWQLKAVVAPFQIDI